jgi:hypothetical protein
MGFEPTTSAVQMRPDERVTVRSRLESAANTYILMVGVDPLIRPESANIAWVGVKTRLQVGVDVETLRSVQFWSTIEEERR